MASIRRPTMENQVIRIASDSQLYELLLMRGGQRAYLFVRPNQEHESRPSFSIGGPKTLRALAKAILEEIPE